MARRSSNLRPRATRVDRLAARVRWLDRWRRPVAILAAGVLAPLAIDGIVTATQTRWNVVHGLLMLPMLAAVCWWVIEAALAGLTAVWETDVERVLRRRGLPVATVVPRRRT